MEVILDQTSLSFPKELPLSKMIVELSESFKGTKILRSVFCNGHKLVGDQALEDLEKPIGKFEKIEVQTFDVSMGPSYSSLCVEMLSKMITSLIHVSQLLKEKRIEEGFSLLVKCFEVLERFLEHISILGLGAFEADIAEMETDVSRVLQKLMDLLVRKDFVNLSDCLEYELIDNLYQWKLWLIGRTPETDLFTSEVDR